MISTNPIQSMQESTIEAGYDWQILGLFLTSPISAVTIPKKATSVPFVTTLANLLRAMLVSV
jgi:hypothetical protein